MSTRHRIGPASPRAIVLLWAIGCGEGPVATAPEDTDGPAPATTTTHAPPSSEDGSSGDETGEAPPTACTEVGQRPLLRLTPRQIHNAIRDVLGLEVDVGKLDPAEKVGPFDANASALVSLATVDQYRVLAEEVAATLDVATLAACDPAEDACVESFVVTLGRRLFRRTLDADVAQRYLDLAAAEAVPEERLRVAVQAMLQSPHFLYHVELEPHGEASDDLVALDDAEVASRLSFFLWNSVPDGALLDAADAGELQTTEGLRAQAERLLDDPRARQAVGDFHVQWLGLDHVEGVTKDADVHPEWSPDLLAAMLDETRRFAVGVVLHGDARLDTLFTSPWAYLDGALFDLYGVESPAEHVVGDPIALPSNERAGLLTRAAFLAVHAHPDQSGPVQRGAVVRTTVLCDPPPPPPPDAMVVPPEPDPNATTRELFEQHTVDPACAGCHVLIDGIGLGFEAYDGMGAFRSTQNGKPVDASGDLVGTDVDGEFDGAIDLSERLAGSEMVHRCVARQWFRYALGRAETEADACTLESLDAAFADSDLDIRELLLAIATSEAFRLRPAP